MTHSVLTRAHHVPRSEAQNTMNGPVMVLAFVRVRMFFFLCCLGCDEGGEHALLYFLKSSFYCVPRCARCSPDRVFAQWLGSPAKYTATHVAGRFCEGVRVSV